MAKKNILILYHFFYPDDVVSARHFSDFAEGLVQRGWDVTVLTSNRYCRYKDKKIDLSEEYWMGIRIIRSYRPSFDQSKNIPRLINTLWLAFSWILQIMKLDAPDVIVLGSDPQFSQFMMPMIRLLKKRARLVYWCYDLYPEAIIADRGSGIFPAIITLMKKIMKFNYKFADLMADIGSCMQQRLNEYNHNAETCTLVPWALAEPESISAPNDNVRKELFGNARLALLYSGNMGKAHSFELFIKLARKVSKKESGIVFCFACRGNRYAELAEALKEDDNNIKFADFANESQLLKRLCSADMHMLSLREGWEGVVVPSKFFGSLAVGRPVIYAGPNNSAIKKWIDQFDTGLYLSEQTIDKVADQLAAISNDKHLLDKWQYNAFSAYNKYFSKKVTLDTWDKKLRSGK